MLIILKIQLKGITKPPVWRKLSVPASYTFDDLHRAIQYAFGWGNYHLYQFTDCDEYDSVIGIPDQLGELETDLDAREVWIGELLQKPGDTCVYTYDFGDFWEHKIKVEGVTDGQLDHAICSEGKGTCPPEDCGGIYGYSEFKEAMADPAHPEHLRYKEWLGYNADDNWDPNEVNIPHINQLLAKLTISDNGDDAGNKKRPLAPPIIELPVLNHPALSVFFETASDIDRDLIYEFMSLPRETLVEDLRNILLVTIRQYDAFLHPGLEERHTFFPLHALNMLAALDAEEALDDVLEVFGQDVDFLDFWLGDILTEDFWQYLYRLGRNKLDSLKAFVLDPSHDTYAGSAVSIAVCHLSQLNDTYYKEALAWFEDVLTEMYTRRQTSPETFNKELFSMLVGDLVDLGDSSCLSKLKPYFDERLVSPFAAYEWAEAKKIMESGKSRYGKSKEEVCTNIDEFYDMLTFWDPDLDDFTLGKHPAIFNEPWLQSSHAYTPPVYPPLPLITSPKVGRNDPCPCGSGKKFKKCCGNN